MIRIESVKAGILSIPSCLISQGICAITGSNGSGKTTFLKLLSGILTPAEGTVCINGKEPSDLKVGWVGEYPDRNMLFTRVFDELASPLRFVKLPCKEIEKEVIRCAKDLEISHLLCRDIHGLSGGELVLVAFGAALIAKPDLLILDETDSHLDDEFCTHLDLIIKKTGIGHVVFSTHRPERIAIADEIITLKEGRILRHSSLSEKGSYAYREYLDDPWFWRRIYAETTSGDFRENP
ncbi:ABC transporter ATP-binding protein [Methanospirillum stamsii]|uniref:ABC transporter n=1 Tax=Methanospirillum stamsii TaxID=1277351 RepID=A0A2V2MXT2_9EURY|nr:ABC transporter ATP-binding protein [Methanospirillum stamsii]PWR72944.1 ABC transporter [Methanospirillum stamsii]